MAHEGAEPTPSTPEAFGQHLSAELKRWIELVERIGLKVP
jgi:tripartite-type tricarboxylate transporter receptor subunit TctC